MDRADFAALQTFLMIAERGSLRAAARALGVNPPAISSQLNAFEQRLGTPLFMRNTRSISLTDAGRALRESSRHLIDGLGDALEDARGACKAQSGCLRITLPFRAWQLVIAPRLAAFSTAYPGIVLDLDINEGLTDIADRGFHAGIRLGDHLQNDMIAVRLSLDEAGAYIASPGYLAQAGTPQSPDDLLTHACIRHRGVHSGQIADWQFVTPQGALTFAATGHLILNDLRAVVDAALQGFGIGWSLQRGVAAEIAAGQLVPVLTAFTPMRPGFFLYFPRHLQKIAMLRAFVDHFRLGQHRRPEPPE
jgi:DNA-binding transcriptional LysR family regulator